MLGEASVFLTHCGMNSVSESIWCGVPMVLAPQQSEEAAVARRAAELGAGLRLERRGPGGGEDRGDDCAENRRGEALKGRASSVYRV